MAYTRTIRTYRYVDKNPVIDEMRTAVQDAGLMKKLNLVAVLAGLNYATPKNWFHGDVRDPRHSSTMAVMTSLGYKNQWVKANGKWDLDKEVAAARAWLKDERAKAQAEPKRKKRKK